MELRRLCNVPPAEQRTMAELLRRRGRKALHMSGPKNYVRESREATFHASFQLSWYTNCTHKVHMFICVPHGAAALLGTHCATRPGQIGLGQIWDEAICSSTFHLHCFVYTRDKIMFIRKPEHAHATTHLHTHTHTCALAHSHSCLEWLPRLQRRAVRIEQMGRCSGFR